MAIRSTSWKTIIPHMVIFVKTPSLSDFYAATYSIFRANKAQAAETVAAGVEPTRHFCPICLANRPLIRLSTLPWEGFRFLLAPWTLRVQGCVSQRYSAFALTHHHTLSATTFPVVTVICWPCHTFPTQSSSLDNLCALRWFTRYLQRHSIWMTGFEPATSWTQIKRTAKLCYIQIKSTIYQPCVKPISNYNQPE